MTIEIGRRRPGSNTRSKFSRTAPEGGGGTPNPPVDPPANPPNDPPPPANVTNAGTDFTALLNRLDALPEVLGNAVKEAFPKATAATPPANNPPASTPPADKTDPPKDDHPEPGKRPPVNDGRSKLAQWWFS